MIIDKRASALACFCLALTIAATGLQAQVNSLGACCLSNSECELKTSQGCLDSSGFFNGEGTNCADYCPAKMSSTFTYSGQIKEGALPYAGLLDLYYSLWDLPVGGQRVAGPVGFSQVPVANGLFQSVVDFGEGAFGAEARWLEISICSAGAPPESCTIMQPRQLITAVPFSLQTRGIVVNEQGQVGIKTPAPTRELDVTGGIKSRELHLANPSGLPLARWDGTRIEPGPDQFVAGSPPTTVTTITGSPAWSNPSAVLLSDDVRATLSLTQSGQGPTETLRITGFDFSLPVDAIVTQAIIHTEGSRSCSCTQCIGQYANCWMSVPARLISDGETGYTWHVAPSLGTEGVDIIGFPAESDWSAAMYNSPGFGIELQGNLLFSSTCSSTCGYGVPECGCECFGCTGLGSVSIDSLSMELKYHQQVVVDRQWSLGMASSDSRFVIAPTSDLSTPSITILTNGKVGFGVADPVYQLHLPNTTFPSGMGQAQAHNWWTYSSRRWKENIERIPDALDKVLRLNGVMFDWAAAQGGGRDIGFVAEDVARIVPELVQMEVDGKNASGMKYDRVTALAVEAIKELNVKLTEKQGEIDALRAEKDAQIQSLESRIKRLESREGHPGESDR